MPGFNTRDRQVGVKVEASVGVAETLTAAEFRGNLKDVEAIPNIPKYERALDHATLSKDAALTGPASLTVKFTAEAVGGGIASPAPWEDALLGCGFKSTQLKVITIGSITGTIKRGDTIGNNVSQGSATKTGTVVAVVAGKIYYVPVLSAFISSDNIFGYGSPTGSCTASGAPTNAGRRFNLVSRQAAVEPQSCTVQCYQHGQMHTGAGHRGTVKFSYKHGEPLMLMFEFQGPIKLTSGTSPSSSPITGIAALGVPPKVARGFPLTSNGITPITTSLEVDVANVLTLRPTTADNDVYGSGYLDTTITDRQPKATLDPEKPALATTDFQLINTAGTTFPLFTQVGALGDTNGAFILESPCAQFQGDYGEGDRNGMVTVPHDLKLCGVPGGAGDDELIFDHVVG